MHPAMEKLENHYKGKHGILIASAECQTSQGSSGSGASLCDHFKDKVRGYPTILYGDCSHSKSEYQGGRSYSSLLSFVQKHLESKGVDEIIDAMNSTNPLEAQPMCPVTVGASSSVLV